MKIKTPKYTDLHRFPRPYRHAKDTNVADTFAAEYKRLARETPKPFVPKVVCDLAEVFRTPIRRQG